MVRAKRIQRPPSAAPQPAPERAAWQWPAVDLEIQADIGDLFAAIAALESGDFQRLAAFWATIDPADRDRAHARAQAAVARTGRTDFVHDVQERLLAWASPSEASRHGRIEAWLPAPDTIPYDRRAAQPALLDTALALAAQDELDEADFDALFGPWLDAIGDGDGEADRDDGRSEAAGPDAGRGRPG